jgi:hypothetical protein
MHVADRADNSGTGRLRLDSILIANPQPAEIPDQHFASQTSERITERFYPDEVRFQS